MSKNKCYCYNRMSNRDWCFDTTYYYCPQHHKDNTSITGGGYDRKGVKNPNSYHHNMTDEDVKNRIKEIEEITK